MFAVALQISLECKGFVGKDIAIYFLTAICNEKEVAHSTFEQLSSCISRAAIISNHGCVR